MNDTDLYIIIKALLWYIPDTPLPSDEEIKRFITHNKLKLMCMECSDYELCLRDNSKCYQYLEEEKRLNACKKKGLNQEPNKNNL